MVTPLTAMPIRARRLVERVFRVEHVALTFSRVRCSDCRFRQPVRAIHSIAAGAAPARAERVPRRAARVSVTGRRARCCRGGGWRQSALPERPAHVWSGDVDHAELLARAERAQSLAQQANEALIEFLAAHYGVAKRDVRIVAGLKSRQKRVEISGLP